MPGFRFKSYFLRGRAPIRIVGGSILLRKGAGGGASSYASPDEYHKTTGQGLYGQGLYAQGNRGMGLEKLAKLNVVQPIGKRIKNIRF